MMQFSKDAYRELNQYEQHFIRAVRGGYTMGVTPKLAEEFLRWYKALGGNKHINLGCSNCIYTMVKDLGNAYFAWVKDAQEKHPAWLQDDEPDMTEEELEKAADEINQAIIEDMKKNASESTIEEKVEEQPAKGGKVSTKGKKATSPKAKKNKGDNVKTDNGKDN